MTLIFQKGKDNKVSTILKYNGRVVGMVTTSNPDNFSKEEGFMWCWLLHINNLDKKKLYKMYDMCKKSARADMLRFLLEEYNRRLSFNFDAINNIPVKGGE